MKRVLLVFISMLVILSIAGCRDRQEDVREEAKEPDVVQEEQQGKVEVDQGLFNVEITIPATLVNNDDADIDDIIDEAQDKGIKEIVRNDDGSLTFKMSKNEHRKMMKEITEEIQETMLDIKTDDDFVSIRDLEANESFSQFTMKVDRDAFENSLDAFAALALAMQGMIYQVFDGVDQDELQVIIDIEDADTGELIDTVIYPDDLETNNTQT